MRNEITFKKANIGCGEQILPEKDISDDLTDSVTMIFQSAFREIFNLIDLALEEKKATIAKSSIGHTLDETRTSINREIYNYFHTDSKL
jgi:hypothetical protein